MFSISSKSASGGNEKQLPMALASIKDANNEDKMAGGGALLSDAATWVSSCGWPQYNPLHF